MNRISWLVGATVLGTVLGGCEPGATPSGRAPAGAPAEASAVAQFQSPIVNGTIEAGYPAIGALVLETPQFGYSGSFCTGTLIAPEWVLTAAHCLTGDGGFEGFIEAGNVQFFLGADANPIGFGNPPTLGRRVPSIALYVNPKYLGQSSEDVALMRLAEPITDVTPMVLYPGPFGSAFVGETLTYVGYGVTDGDAQKGGGIKRRAEMDIALVEESTYTNQFEDQGVCFGDSGGPGLYFYDGQWTIMGVNSAVFGSQNATPCTELTLHTRTDKHRDWVYGIIDNPPEIKGCLLDKSYCSCPAACLADGECDESVCPILGSCEGLTECLGACYNSDCEANCHGRATPVAQQSYDMMTGCIDDTCAGLGGYQYSGCAYGTCGDLVVQCFEPNGSAGDDCKTVTACITNCVGGGGGGGACFGQCLSTASVKGRVEYTKLRNCGRDACQGMQQSSPQYQTCIAQNCPDELIACNDDETPVPCDPVDPSCPDGMACVPAGDGAATCRDTMGWSEGLACHPLLPDGPECAPGLVCGAVGESNPTCMPVCGGDADCDNGRTCLSDDAGLPPGISVCVCVDADGDDVCSADDCNDDDPDTSPDAEEACDDEIDNNCDGQVNEGCEAGGESGGGESGGNGDSSEEGGSAVEVDSAASSGGCHQGAHSTGWPLLSLLVLGLVIRRPSRHPSNHRR